MKKGLTLITVLIILWTVALASAGEGPGERHRRGPARFDDVTALPGLNLTAVQKGQIASLREAYIQESRPLRDRLIAKGRALRELWLAPTPDRDRITTLHEEVRQLRVQLNGKAEGYLQEVQRFLTAEQRGKIDAFVRERRHHHQIMRRRPIPGEPPREQGVRERAGGKEGAKSGIDSSAGH